MVSYMIQVVISLAQAVCPISGSGRTPNDAPPGAVLIVRKEPKSPACPPSPVFPGLLGMPYKVGE